MWITSCLRTMFESMKFASNNIDTKKEAAIAISDAVVRWPEWVIRRVDSIHPLEGMRGKLKHSIDCIPPADPKLAYDEEERKLKNIVDVKGQVMVPLAFIIKESMRDLDVIAADGSSIPILSSEESLKISITALTFLLVASGVTYTVRLESAIRELVQLAGEENKKTAEELLVSGQWNGERIWGEEVSLDPLTKNFLLNLSTDFLLIGLIPAVRAGNRQILKLSYHWKLRLYANRRIANAAAAFGIADYEIQLPMLMPYATASYHLEFQVPPELEVSELAIPRSNHNSESISDIKDTSKSPVAHVHARYDFMPEEEAYAFLTVPLRGISILALISSGLTSMIFALALFLPGAMETLMRVGGNAAALLVAVPAVIVGLLAIQKENIFSSVMLNPLRNIMVICGVLLFSMAGSIVGELQQPYLKYLWITGFVVSLFFFLVLLLGRRVSELFTRNEKLETY